MARRLLLTTAAAAAALAPTAALAASAPVQGSIFGAVLTTNGSTFQMSSTLVPGGKATVHVDRATAISAQEAAAVGDVKAGDCVTATGSKAKDGTVTAFRIDVRPTQNGTCSALAFGGPGARRPGGRLPGARPPQIGGKTPTTPRSRFAGGSFGFAAGQVTSAKDGTFVVKGQRGTTSVKTQPTTQVSRTVSLQAGDIKVKECAFVYGSSTDKGLNVTATRIAIQQPVHGTCQQRFGRLPGAGARPATQP